MAHKLTPIKIPLLNPNEPEALLVELAIKEGEAVEIDQVIAVIETTKSTGEIIAEAAGYLVGLRYHQGETLPAGEALAYVGESPDASDPALPPWADPRIDTPEGKDLPVGLRITEPAKALALAKGLPLSTLPQGPLITRQAVQDLLESSFSTAEKSETKGDRRLVIYGAGGHGRSLAALVRSCYDFEVVGFIDDGKPVGAAIDDLPVLGGADYLDQLAHKGITQAINGVGGISDLPARLEVYHQLAKTGFICPTVVHKTAFIEENAVLSDGVQVFPFAYVGISVNVGYGCIINTGTIVSHDCKLAPYVNLSPGATLAGGVTIGEAALIGMQATVNLNVKIGARARVGNGATVKADVPEGGIVPAGTIWPPRL